MNPAEAFRELVLTHSGQRDDHEALTNVTFFVGAGFSKTWDEASPTGYDLFTFPREFLAEVGPQIEFDELLAQPGYPALDDAPPSTFKELIYNLSMQLKYPGIRTRYMDDSSLRFVIDEIKAVVQRRFESVAALNYVDAEGRFPAPAAPTPNQKAILDFFDWLARHQVERGGSPRGVHTDFVSTNYDYVIETILDNTGERNALRNTYRGFTPTLINGARSSNIIQDHWSINTLIKINGGFEIVSNGADYYDIDYRPRQFDDIRERAPEIMMPSKEQNYVNPYFSAIFPKAVRLLQESRVLVIVGYSLSEEDALLRFLIRQFAEDLRDVHGKHIFYVDYTDPGTLEQRLQGCFRYIDRMDVRNVYTVSEGFVDWIREILD